MAERATSPEPSPSQPSDERAGPAEPSIHVPGEEVPLLDPYFASTLPTQAAPRQVDRQKWSTARRLGAASLALAASGLVGVGVGLGFGERADRLGEAELDKSSPSSLRLQEIRVSGENANAAAIGCGVTAGAFAVVGAVLLIVDKVRPTGRRRTAWRPTVGGLEVRF